MQALATLISTTRPAPGPSWRSGGNDGDIRALRPVKLADLDTRHHPLVAVAVEAARTWAQRYRDGETRAPSLVLSGPNGTGKTHIARAIWWSVTQVAQDADGATIAGSTRPVARFFQAAELIAALSPDDDNGGQLPGVGSIVGPSPFLIIDDVGAESNLAYVRGDRQDFERQVRYFRVVDWAYANDVPVIMTTNLRLDELPGHIGPRAWDRLNEMAPFGQMVSLRGVPSWRVKVGGRNAD